MTDDTGPMPMPEDDEIIKTAMHGYDLQAALLAVQCRMLERIAVALEQVVDYAIKDQK